MLKLLRFIKKIKNQFLILSVLTVLIFGCYGFLLEGKTLSDSVFYTLILFIGNYGNSPENIYVDIARYSGLIFVAVTIFSILFDKIYLLGKSLQTRNGILIFGDNDYTRKIISDSEHKNSTEIIFTTQMDWCPIAKGYLLLSDEKENHEYYKKNKKILKGRQVSIRSESVPGLIADKGNIRFFSMEELVARLYWEKYHLLKEYSEKNPESLLKISEKEEEISLTVSMVGMNYLTEELLFYAVQMNIFSPNQKITYHVFGDTIKYRNINKNLDKLGIQVHEGDWWSKVNQVILEKSDRIILADQKDILREAGTIRALFPKAKLHIISMSDYNKDFFLENRTFNSKKCEIQTMIFSLFDLRYEDLFFTIYQDSTIEAAKKVNLKYFELNDKDSVNSLKVNQASIEKIADLLWSELDTFSKFSNISAVSYNKVQREILKVCGKSESDFVLYVDHLAELEHLRWCNYHWVNNWSFDKEMAMKKPGKRKYMLKKLHGDLRPYHELASADKDKNKDNIKILFDLCYK